MNSNKGTIAVAVVALVIAIFGSWALVSSIDRLSSTALAIATDLAGNHDVGGVTNYDELDAAVIKVGGTNGTRLDLVAQGTCSLIAADGTYSVVATSTEIFSCQGMTGVASGDEVDLNFGTSTQANNLAGWLITGYVASSTALNAAEVRIYNLSGQTGMIPAEYASTTHWRVYSATSTVPGL